MEIKEATASLRQIIDEHEKAILEKISINEKQEKIHLEDYKTPLTNELQNLNLQRVTFEMLTLSKNYPMILQTVQRTDDYVNNTNDTLKSLQLPNRNEYFLKGLDQLENLKVLIGQCGRYVHVPPRRNPQLEKILVDNRTQQKLDLSDKNLIDSDMKIVANVLKKSTVRQDVLICCFSEWKDSFNKMKIST
jgi:hypothetical protein